MSLYLILLLGGLSSGGGGGATLSNLSYKYNYCYRY